MPEYTNTLLIRANLNWRAFPRARDAVDSQCRMKRVDGSSVD